MIDIAHTNNKIINLNNMPLVFTLKPTIIIAQICYRFIYIFRVDQAQLWESSYLLKKKDWSQ
jgi:hypothetical protein